MTPQLLTKSHLKRFSKAAFLVLAAALCLGLLGSSPAFAESPNGLPGSGGHTCKKLGDDGTYTSVVCLDLGLYITSTGAQFITAQVELACSFDPPQDGPVNCQNGFAKATVANGSGYTDWASKGCIGVPCQVNSVTNRSYLYPFGGLPISPGVCDDNVWASIQGAPSFSPTFLTPQDNLSQSLMANFATPHYNVCETFAGQILYETP